MKRRLYTWLLLKTCRPNIEEPIHNFQLEGLLFMSLLISQSTISIQLQNIAKRNMTYLTSNEKCPPYIGWPGSSWTRQWLERFRQEVRVEVYFIFKSSLRSRWMTRVECVEHRRQHYHDGSHRGERELRDIFTKFPTILLTVARSYAPCSERSAGLSFGRFCRQLCNASCVRIQAAMKLLIMANSTSIRSSLLSLILFYAQWWLFSS